MKFCKFICFFIAIFSKNFIIFVTNFSYEIYSLLFGGGSSYLDTCNLCRKYCWNQHYWRKSLCISIDFWGGAFTRESCSWWRASLPYTSSQYYNSRTRVVSHNTFNDFCNAQILSKYSDYKYSCVCTYCNYPVSCEHACWKKIISCHKNSWFVTKNSCFSKIFV